VIIFLKNQCSVQPNRTIICWCQFFVGNVHFLKKNIEKNNDKLLGQQSKQAARIKHVIHYIENTLWNRYEAHYTAMPTVADCDRTIAVFQIGGNAHNWTRFGWDTVYFSRGAEYR
jgi:hypothetical protein